MPKAAKQKAATISDKLVIQEALYESPGSKPLTSHKILAHGIAQGYWKEETGGVKGAITRCLKTLQDDGKITNSTKQSYILTELGRKEMEEFDVDEGESSAEEAPVKKTPAKKQPPTSASKTKSAPKKKTK